MTRLRDLTRQRFGGLTVVAYTGSSRWLCRCDCGRDCIRTYKSLHLDSQHACDEKLELELSIQLSIAKESERNKMIVSIKKF